jgi:hypothetical protein
MARKQGKDRGLFERSQGSGIWWVRYFDRDGREHREKIGAKGLARRVYEKRRTDIREGRFFAPERREVVLFESILSEYRNSALKAGREIMRGRYRLPTSNRRFRPGESRFDNPSAD